MSGKFVRARRRFAAPERHVGRSSLRVFHEHAASLHAADAPGCVSQQHDVASKAFHGEVFVYRADDRALGMGDHGVQRIFWNGAAAGDGGKTAATARANDAVYAVAMQVGSVASAGAGDAFRKHLDDFVELRAREIAVGTGMAHGLE